MLWAFEADGFVRKRGLHQVAVVFSETVATVVVTVEAHTLCGNNAHLVKAIDQIKHR